MSAWGAGYVTDVEYVEGFHLQQAASRMALACQLNGVAARTPEAGERFRLLELGCGRGMNALAAAAANPGWEVTGIDFNPAHVAMARELAASAGLLNVQFLEADLSTLAGSAEARDIAPADAVTLHGVWTWVSPEVRAGIVRLLADKTLPGSMVHVGYNAMPGWQGGLGLQRLVYEAGRRSAGRSDRQAVAGLDFALEAKQAGARQLDLPLAQLLLDRVRHVSGHYLSHEYMNRFWQPVFHADLAEALGAAKLEFAGSTNLLENFPQLMLSDEQRALHDRHDDPAMRELFKDVTIGRTFRHDVFVRGIRRMPRRETEARLSAVELVPMVLPEQLSTEIEVPAGKAEMSETLGRMMRACLEGVRTVGELLGLEPGRSSAAELIGVLVGSGQAEPAFGTAGPCDPGSAASRLNRRLGERVGSLLGPPGSATLACAETGGGVLASPLDQFIAARLLVGEREDRAGEWIRRLSQDVPPEEAGKVADYVGAAVARRLPVLRARGIVPA